MKNVTAVLAILGVILFPAGAFASCPDSVDYYCPGPSCYTVYSYDLTCGSVNGDNVETDETMSCNNWPAIEFANGNGSVDFDMTVPSGKGGSYWSVSLYVDFDDPVYHYFGDTIIATVIVRHNGSITTYNPFFSHTGEQGSMSCELVGSGYFSTQDGDTITVNITGNNGYYANIKSTSPLIFSN
jgi:hypothetical protein